MTLHPRLSVNSISSMSYSVYEDLALWADLGIDHVGLITPKLEEAGWDASRRALLESGVRISSVSCYKDGIEGSAEFTASVGADVLYLPPGTGGSRLWEEAADDFARFIGPWVEHARGLGVTLALESTNPLRTDVSFVHSLRDAVDLARTTGMGVVVDFYSTWYERGFAQLVEKNMDVVSLVQIGDYRLGTFDMPNRCAIGDGDIPVERLMAVMLDAGYQGVFDLEILGSQVEREGYRAPIARSIERATEMLERLGA